MSTTAPTPAAIPIDLDISTPKVSMATLAKVELRKALDTRAGRWLAIGILGLVVVVTLIFSLRGGRRRSAPSRSTWRSPGSRSATSCRCS